MSNKILNLIFKATDKASPTLDKLQGASGQSGVGGLTDSLKKMINPATLAMGAVTGLGAAVIAATKGWQDYAIEVADFNAMIDGTIEETSVLIELSKDYDVTMDTMLAAMRSLAASGIEPNIEGLIQLRAQLDATASASDRLKLAQQLIGEQGIKQILPMLDELNDKQLRNYVDNLTEAEKVTEEMAEAAREQRKVINDLTDSWEAVKLSAGGWTAEMFAPMLKAWASVLSGQKTYLEAWAQMKSDEAAEGIDLHTRSLQGVEEAAADAAEAIDDLTIAETWLAAAEAVMAGNYALANRLIKDAEGAQNAEDAVRNLIDALKELDGTKASYDVFGTLHEGTGGPAWKDQGIGPAVNVPSGTGGWGPWQLDALGRRYRYNSTTGGYEKGYQAGGSFEVGGSGGPDSQRVGIDVTPGEIVNVSQEDTMRELLLVMKRLPTTIADALERKL